MSETIAAEPEVLFEVRGHAGIITLNRPRAINALTHTMVRLIRAKLDEWVHDAAVRTVVLVGSGERGLCAGGDIVALYRDATEGDGSSSIDFWRDEYDVNDCIDRYPKPYVALMQGIVLGGGIGVSAHGSHRVVTDDSRLGLPETGIGFVPDVGATWLLSHAPGELGTYLALTAGSVRAADAIEVGLADVFVAKAELPELLSDLQELDADAAIARHARPAASSELATARAWIDDAFVGDSVPGILRRLRRGGAEANLAADTIEAKSPLALSVTLESLRRARELPDLTAALRQELTVSSHLLRTPDFAEGVRAQVIDKDRNPAWRPSSFDDITPTMIGRFFDAETAPRRRPDDAEMTPQRDRNEAGEDR